MLRTRRARSCNIHEILQLVFPYVEIDSVPGHFEIPSETLFRKLGTKKGFSGVLELAAGAPGSVSVRREENWKRKFDPFLGRVELYSLLVSEE